MIRIFNTLFFIIFFIASCSINTKPISSDYIVVEDKPNNSNSSPSLPPIIDNDDPSIPSNYKEYYIENISASTKVYVNTDNFFEKNSDLEKYYRLLVGDKKVINKDTKKERYRFDDNLDLIEYNEIGANIVYKKYIQAVLVRMKDNNYPLDGKYVVGGLYKVEIEDKKVNIKDRYEIIVYNNFRHYIINNKKYYVVSIFNVPSSDINENYNPENVYSGKYSSVNNSYLNWTLVPKDF